LSCRSGRVFCRHTAQNKTARLIAGRVVSASGFQTRDHPARLKPVVVVVVVVV
jgi:hypothetical protein